MRKNAALSFRVPLGLKAKLEAIAEDEGRSLSQICEALLGGGIEGYKNDGPKYIQRFLPRSRKEDSSG